MVGHPGILLRILAIHSADSASISHTIIQFSALSNVAEFILFLRENDGNPIERSYMFVYLSPHCEESHSCSIHEKDFVLGI